MHALLKYWSPCSDDKLRNIDTHILSYLTLAQTIIITTLAGFLQRTSHFEIDYFIDRQGNDDDSLLPLICSLVDTLYVSSEKLRKGVVAENLALSGQVHFSGIEVELL